MRICEPDHVAVRSATSFRVAPVPAQRDVDDVEVCTHRTRPLNNRVLRASATLRTAWPRRETVSRSACSYTRAGSILSQAVSGTGRACCSRQLRTRVGCRSPHSASGLVAPAGRRRALSSPPSPGTWDENQVAALVEIAHALPRIISPHVRGDVGAVEDLRQIVLTDLALYVMNRPLARQEMFSVGYRIAQRRIVDWYRKSRPVILCPMDDELLLEAVIDVGDMADRVAASIDLERALGRLSPQQRRVAVLFYLGGLSREDVADAMSISVETVKKHLADGRKRARQLDELAEYGRPPASQGGD